VKVRLSGLSDGTYLTVWDESNNLGASLGLFGQRFKSDGSSSSSVFKINSFDTTANSNLAPNQLWPSVTKTQNGGFAVTWRALAAESLSKTISTKAAINTIDSLFSSSSGPTLDSPSDTMAAITAIDNAIKMVNIQRSKLGAVSNRLSHIVNNLSNISSNLSAAQGSIEDADFAKETTNLAKNQILQQASTAMLAQAKPSKQNVLSLLQG